MTLASTVPPSCRPCPGAPPPNRTVILSRLLSRDDWFTQAKAAKLLSIALKSSPADDSPIISQFLEWLTGQLRQPSHGEETVLVASGALAGLLRSRDVRSEYARGVPLLVRPRLQPHALVSSASTRHAHRFVSHPVPVMLLPHIHARMIRGAVAHSTIFSWSHPTPPGHPVSSNLLFCHGTVSHSSAPRVGRQRQTQAPGLCAA